MPGPNLSGSGYSGEDRRVYESGDQENTGKTTLEEMNRTHNGNLLGHSKNPKKQTELANHIIEQDQQESGKYTQKSMAQRDPTAPAISHGNHPSRGARIDKELQEDDQAILKKKGDTMPGKH